MPRQACRRIRPLWGSLLRMWSSRSWSGWNASFYKSLSVSSRSGTASFDATATINVPLLQSLARIEGSGIAGIVPNSMSWLDAARRCALFLLKSALLARRKTNTARVVLGDQKRYFLEDWSLRVGWQRCNRFLDGIRLRVPHHSEAAHREVSHQSKLRTATQLMGRSSPP